MTKVPSLSVFFPAFNEEKNIGDTVQKALSLLPKFASQFEIVVVNDGSIDHTREIVENIVKDNPQVRLVNHQQNLGYGAALKTGFYNCQFPLIAFTDSDGQFDINQLDRFLEEIDSYDLVVGFRIKRAERVFRFWSAKAWGFLMRLLFGLNVKDIDCGFKLVRKEVLEKIPKLESTGALISAELLIKTKKAGFKICEIGVDHFPRKAGQQTGANFKVILKAFWELLKLYPKLR